MCVRHMCDNTQAVIVNTCVKTQLRDLLTDLGCFILLDRVFSREMQKRIGECGQACSARRCTARSLPAIRSPAPRRRFPGLVERIQQH